MKVVVVGGQCRNIGKTSVVERLIRDLKSLAWTAAKITQDRHDTFSSSPGPRKGGQARSFVLTEEHDPHGRGDTCRFVHRRLARRQAEFRLPALSHLS